MPGLCVLSSTLIFCCRAYQHQSDSKISDLSSVHLNVECYGWVLTPFITPSPSESVEIQRTHTRTLLLTLPDMKVYQPSLSGGTHLP